MLDGKVLRSDLRFVPETRNALLTNIKKSFGVLTKSRQMERLLVDDDIIADKDATPGYDLDLPSEAEFDACAKEGRLENCFVDGILQTYPGPVLFLKESEQTALLAEIDALCKRKEGEGQSKLEHLVHIETAYHQRLGAFKDLLPLVIAAFRDDGPKPSAIETANAWGESESVGCIAVILRTAVKIEDTR